MVNERQAFLRAATRRQVPISLLCVASTFAHAQFDRPVRVIEQWSGFEATDRMGTMVRELGDVNCDGVPDIGIGARFEADEGVDAGKLYIFSGADGQIIRVHEGEQGNAVTNFSLISVGDVTGDGCDDYVYGAPDTQSFQRFVGPGNVHLISGADGSTVHTWTGEGFAHAFGMPVVGAGSRQTRTIDDINGDGSPDIIIAARRYRSGGQTLGRAYVYSAVAPFELIHAIDGPVPNTSFASGVGGLGDITGDGFADFAVGAPGAGPNGELYVYSGKDASELPFSPILGGPSSGSFGSLFIGSAGDATGDGINDIYVGDLGDSGDGVSRGRFSVYSGADGALVWSRAGQTDGEQFGIGRGTPDVNFDGVPDFIVASFTESTVATRAGAGYVLDGTTGEILNEYHATHAEGFLGWSVGDAGDFDQDGAIDYLLTAPNTDANGLVDSGTVFLVAGEILPCQADLDADGDADADDFFSYLDAFAQGNTQVCDIDGDSDCDADDFFGYLDLFAQGC